jgi:hypothetical protein
MSNFEDSNWGRHGNPNPEWWYRYPRGRRDLPSIFSQDPVDSTWDFLDGFVDDTPKVSLFTVVLILVVILLASGLSITVRELLYRGFDFAQIWYSGVDSMLDTFNVPKAP